MSAMAPRRCLLAVGLLGAGVGAASAQSGRFAVLPFGKFRLSARLVDTRSGQIVQVVSNDDPRRQDRAALDAIVQQGAERLASEDARAGPDRTQGR